MAKDEAKSEAEEGKKKKKVDQKVVPFSESEKLQSDGYTVVEMKHIDGVFVHVLEK